MNMEQGERYGTRFVEMLTIITGNLTDDETAATLTEIGYDPQSESDMALLAAAAIASAMLTISTEHAQHHALDGETEECHLDAGRVVQVWTSTRELAR